MELNPRECREEKAGRGRLRRRTADVRLLNPISPLLVDPYTPLHSLHHGFCSTIVSSPIPGLSKLFDIAHYQVGQQTSALLMIDRDSEGI